MSDGPMVATVDGRVVQSVSASGWVVDENGRFRVVKRALANVAAGQTDASVIAAKTGFKYRILWVVALAGGTATNLTFNTKSSAAGTAISPLLANGINGGEVLPFNQHGWWETKEGEGLTVTTGAGATTGIQVGYIEIGLG